MRRGTLAFRLYALALFQLVLLGGAVVGVGFLIEPARPEHGAEMAPGPPPPAFEPGSGPHGPPHGPPPPGPGADRGGLRRGHPGPLRPLLTFFFSGLIILGIGSVLTARWILRPLHALSRAARALGDGDLRARTGLARDDELGDVARAFDDMAERIQKLLSAERELLANVSHELRTPLARIRVALDIAGEGDAEAGRISMTEIGVDLGELESLIDDILTTARLEASVAAPRSTFALHFQDTAPDVLCTRAADRLRAMHPRRPLDVTVAPGLPDVRVDPVLFRRVLDNLLENAHKYSPDHARPIRLRAALEDDKLLFEVKDEGMGIQAEDLPHVFTAFFRGERSRSRGTGGVGLGLTLARRIVDAHGGTIDVTSAPGDGTRVIVKLPRASA
ncbi:MAG TPA: HAMP domain-containing sensor histidine kinase [Polyangiaceae bacterium]|jgi:signal transduction histidine kinase